jgi:hypothetical protein
VGADFGHDESLFALSPEGVSEALLAEALMIVPGVIEKRNSGVQSLGYDFICFLLVLG